MRTDERMIAIALRSPEEGALEGVFQAAATEGTRGAVVAAPHPLYGGSMDSPVVSELAWAAVQVGIASVRFNWRGVGASTGVPSGVAEDADADYGAALAHVAASVPGPIIACGYSFGAVAALRAARLHPRIERAVLVAPPPALLEGESLELAKPLLVLTGERDELAPPGPLRAALDGKPGARLVIVPEADHFFVSGLAHIGREAGAWLEDPLG
jgi:alpha/beta superfamily hydrolase